MKKPNYEIENYCRGCKIIYPKTVSRCSVCHRLIATVPNTGIRDKKPRIE